MREYRLLFEKDGRGVYISHLDLMRTVTRSFLRAGLQVRHTEGFNPRPHMVFALPLPVGCASVCELVDFQLLQEIPESALPELLAPCCPEGIRPIRAWTPERKFRDIKYLAMEGVLEYDRPTDGTDARAAEALFGKDEGVVVLRKTKRGEGEFDLAPHVTEFRASPEGDTLRATLVLSAQEPSVNPSLLSAAMTKYLGERAPVCASWKRTEVFDAQMRVFR